MSKFSEKTTRKNLFTYKEENLPFETLKELRERAGDGPFVIRGLWISRKNTADAHPVAVITGYNIDLPKHTLADVEEYLQDPETVEEINNGECAFVLRDYENKFGKHIGINWVENKPTEV